MIPASLSVGRTLRRRLTPLITRAAAVPGADRYRKPFSSGSHLWLLVLYGLQVSPSLRRLHAAVTVDGRLCRRIGLAQGISLSQLARSATSRPSACLEQLVRDAMTLAHDQGRRDRRWRILRRVLILDSTFLPLSAARSPWSRVGGHVPGVRLQTGYDLARRIPAHLWLTDVTINDHTARDRLDLAPYRGWTLVVDLGYYGHRAFARLQDAGVGFVCRLRHQAHYLVTASRPVSGTPTRDGDRLLADETITLGSANNRRGAVLPDRRLITSVHARGDTHHFVTDRFDLTAVEIVRLYRKRWQIELFFRFLKYQLHLLVPIGHSPQAVWATILLAALVSILLLLTGVDPTTAPSRIAWLTGLSMSLLISLRGG